jgi:hypothetical protein
MKFFQGALLLCAISSAGKATTMIHERLGGVGEYPPAYRVLKALSLKLHKGPTKELAAELKCSLNATHKINFARGTSMARTTQTGLVKALRDTEVDVFHPGGDSEQKLKVTAGEILEVLTYYSEGWCQIAHQGKKWDAFCPGNSQEDGFIQERDLELEEWIWLSCKENNGWISAEELAPLRESGLLESINPWD